MIGELVFLELAPDRGSEYVEDTLSKALDLCTAHDAQLLFVDFAQEGGWRHHPFMSRLMQLAPVSCMGLYPDPLMIDGLMFDPIEHFRHMRKIQSDQKPGRRGLTERRQCLCQRRRAPRARGIYDRLCHYHHRTCLCRSFR